ncbi:hypothetical protein HK101_002932 [Irineochytrium annulatum]|nr:hypothetical protein HK101_002932 [Irineochytrium annulatum]
MAPARIALTRSGPIFVLTLQDSDNRLAPPFIAEFNARLDEVERALAAEKPEAAALVTRIDVADKIWSNGLELSAAVEMGLEYFRSYQRLLERILCFPIPTVAGGCMLALAHDHRVMRKARGYICVNEVDLPGPLSPGMMDLIRSKVVAPGALRRMVMEGERFTGDAAVAAGFVDEAVDGDPAKVQARSMEIATKWSEKYKGGLGVYAALKRELWSVAAKRLLSDDLGYVGATFNANSKL